MTKARADVLTMPACFALLFTAQAVVLGCTVHSRARTEHMGVRTQDVTVLKRTTTAVLAASAAIVCTPVTVSKSL